jgi:hypothetical protein
VPYPQLVSFHLLFYFFADIFASLRLRCSRRLLCGDFIRTSCARAEKAIRPFHQNRQGSSFAVRNYCICKSARKTNVPCRVCKPARFLSRVPDYSIFTGFSGTGISLPQQLMPSSARRCSSSNLPVLLMHGKANHVVSHML